MILLCQTKVRVCLCVIRIYYRWYILDDVISLHDDDSIVDCEAGPRLATARLIPGVDATEARFPASFYAVDVHKAFTLKSTSKLTIEAQFERLFQLPWKSSTYYDHKARWFSVQRDARDSAVAAGYSDAGCYINFLEAHRSKDAELKAMKRRVRAGQRN